MTTYSSIRPIVLLASLVAILGLPCAAAQAVESSSPGGPSLASTGGQMSPAAGAVEDTLKACLARIPKDASAGQSMLAELGCQRDQQTRTSLQTAPKF